MKIILSRKGFDTSSGGMPSPILPDGTLLSLPIPADFSPTRYADLRAPDGQSYGALMRQLGWSAARRRRGWRQGSPICHADPDLRREALPRLAGWRPAFGQIGIGQSQLEGHEIGAGDVFLFFGLFRQANRQGRALRFEQGARPVHAVYGWLQVGEVLDIPDGEAASLALARYPWLAQHPHLNDLQHWRKRITSKGPNRIYLAAPGRGGPLAFAPQRVLSHPQHTLSRWRRFEWMGVLGNRRFSRVNSPASLHRGYLDTHIGRWQELVIDSADYPLAVLWCESLVEARLS